MDRRENPRRRVSASEGTDEFYMFRYKILTCPRRYSHDWTSCPYAHSGESARRRDPTAYRPIPCPESRTGRPCPRGESCKYAHNDFEYWLHPTRYRTEYCKQGPGCKRKVCFFAHKPCELRKPADVIDTLNARGWLMSTSRTKKHDRNESASSVESADTLLMGGIGCQSSGSLDSSLGQGASPGSHNERPTITAGNGKEGHQYRVGHGILEVPNGRTGVCSASPKDAQLQETQANFANATLLSAPGFASVLTNEQMAIEQLRKVLAGCHVNTVNLNSVDPSMLVAALTGSGSPGAVTTSADDFQANVVDGQRLLAYWNLFLGELEKQKGGHTGSGSGTCMPDGNLKDSHQILAELGGNLSEQLLAQQIVANNTRTSFNHSALAPGIMGSEVQIPHSPPAPPLMPQIAEKLALDHLLSEAIAQNNSSSQYNFALGLEQKRMKELQVALNSAVQVQRSGQVSGSIGIKNEDKLADKGKDKDGQSSVFETASHRKGIDATSPDAGKQTHSVPSLDNDVLPPLMTANHLRRFSIDMAQLAGMGQFEINSPFASNSLSTCLSARGSADSVFGSQTKWTSLPQSQSLDAVAIDDLMFGMPDGLP